MFFLCLTFFISSAKRAYRANDDKPPLVIFPPMFGSVLYGTVTNVPTSHWFCPRNLKDSWIWETDQYLISPISDCMASYLQCGWNYTTNRPDSRNESYIYTVDFGGDQGIRYLDRGIFGYHFVHDMDGFLDHMEAKGLKVGENMFGAPYDWRLSPVGIEQFYVDAQKLIEKVFEQTNKKVVIFGYSGGCFSLQYFLARKVSQSWKDKYIDHIIMMGPSYGGSADALICLWTGLSWFPNADSQAMKDWLLSIPTLYAHMPNYLIHEGLPAIIDPNNRTYSYPEVRQLLYDLGKVDNLENRMTYEFSEKDVLNAEVADPGVDAYLIFNSALPTPIGFDFSNTTAPKLDKIDVNFLGVKKTLKLNHDRNDDWDNLQQITGEGDGCIMKQALYHGCNNWKSGHSVVCHDFRVLNESYGHGSMIGLPDVLDEVYQNIVDDSWRQRKGNFVIEGRRRNFDNMRRL